MCSYTGVCGVRRDERRSSARFGPTASRSWTPLRLPASQSWLRGAVRPVARVMPAAVPIFATPSGFLVNHYELVAGLESREADS